MSWISIGNLRRFTDKLFHSALTFDGSVTHNGADEFNGGVKVNTKPLEINGGVKVNTTKAEFNAPVAFTGTTTYKGNELATKADVSSGGSNIKVDVNLSDTSTNPVQNKTIKAALDEKLSTHGGTVTGATTFEHFLRTRLLDITQISPALTLSNSTTGDLVVSVGDKYADVLDSDNYSKYVPGLDGTGATGTWPINISGNALNDSEGNKIVDTYAKKSDIPTSSALDLTPYMKKTADSDLNMGTNKISFPGITVYGQYINGIPTLQINAKGTRGVFVTGPLILNGLSVATQDYVNDRIPTKVSQLSDDVGIAKISNGHLVINGSELWVE